MGNKEDLPVTPIEADTPRATPRPHDQWMDMWEPRVSLLSTAWATEPMPKI